MAWADLGWDGDGGEDVEALFSCLCAASHADREATIRLSHVIQAHILFSSLPSASCYFLLTQLGSPKLILSLLVSMHGYHVNGTVV